MLPTNAELRAIVEACAMPPQPWPETASHWAPAMFPELRADTQAVLIDGAAGYGLSLAEGAFRVQRLDEPVRLLPLRRIGRVLLRQPRSEDLRALLELVSRGVPVHFQDGHGHIAATLGSTDLETAPQVRELITRVEDKSPRPAYDEWLNLQLRHAASCILRQGPRGRIEHFEQQLERYASRGFGDGEFASACNEVRALCFAWIDGELTRGRLRRLADALALRECPLVHDLDRVLAVPLLWSLAPWLREHRKHDPRRRMDFFEVQRTKLERCLALPLSALNHHLGTAPLRKASNKRGPVRRRFVKIDWNESA